MNLCSTVPPEIMLKTSTSSNVQAKISETAVIKCHVTGIPVPQVQWLFNGQLVDQADKRYEVVEDGGTLKIHDVMVADSGRYTCVAKNAAGIAERDFNLEVNGRWRHMVYSASLSRQFT
jgi:Immunoglobulin I-set domain